MSSSLHLRTRSAIRGQTSLTASAGLAFQPVDQVDDGVEPAPGSVADSGPRDGNGEMALAGSCATNEDSIALLGKESARCQLAHQWARCTRHSEATVRGWDGRCSNPGESSGPDSDIRGLIQRTPRKASAAARN